MPTTMMQALREQQAAAGASVTPGMDDEGPASFGNDPEAIAATQTGVALYDCSHWGRIQVSDSDRLRFLHNQSTNNFETLQPGQGCDTVFVTSTARTLDLATAYVTEAAVLLLVSPNRREYLMQWMDRFIFFADKVKLTDLTPTTAAFSLLGPGSEALLSALGIDPLAGQPYGTHTVASLAGIEVRVAVGSGLASPGHTLIVAADQAATLWTRLYEAGAVPLGETVWQQLRVEQGRPAPDAELTEDFNPLEAGLWSTISLSKGCYIGQETIARLHTYRGVKQQLWGVEAAAPVDPGTPLTLGDDKIGILTSCVATPNGYRGLAYIRSKAIASGAADSPIQVGEQWAQLVPLPFVSHEYI